MSLRSLLSSIVLVASFFVVPELEAGVSNSHTMAGEEKSGGYDGSVNGGQMLSSWVAPFQTYTSSARIGGSEPLIYYVDTYINGTLYQKDMMLVTSTGLICAEESFFAALGVPGRLTMPPDGIGVPCIKPGESSDLHIDFQALENRLMVKVPGDWLPSRQYDIGRSEVNIFESYSGVPAFAAALSYDARYGSVLSYGNRVDQGQLSSSIRFYSPAGYFETYMSGSWLDDGDGAPLTLYRRISSAYKLLDHDRHFELSVGDNVSRSFSWSSSDHVLGISLSNRFDIRPDIITYSMPVLSGVTEAAVAADLYLDNRKAGVLNIDPGPYDVAFRPYLSGDGEAVVSYTDASGKQVTEVVKYYVSPNLLRRGLWDYSFSVGVPRLGYTNHDVEYGHDILVSGVVRHGLSDRVTMEYYSKYSDAVRNIGAGVVTGGTAGDLEVATVGSWSDMGFGQRYYVNYSVRPFSSTFLGLDYRYDDDRFAAGDYAYASPVTERASLSLSQSLGSWGRGRVAYVSRRVDDERQGSLDISLNPRMSFKGINLGFTFSQSVDDGDWYAGLSLNVRGPLSSTASYDRSVNEYAETERYALSGYAMENRKIHWSLEHSEEQTDAYKDSWSRAAMQYYGSGATLATSYAHRSDQESFDVGGMGAVMFSGAGVALARDTGDSIVLVDVNEPDVAVRVGNGYYGRSNDKGLYASGNVSPYSPTRVQLDVRSLDRDAVIETNELYFVPRQYSAVKVGLPVRIPHAVMFSLTGDNIGHYAGYPISLVGAAEVLDAFIGYDGIVYLDDVKPGVYQLVLKEPLTDSPVCAVDIDLTGVAEGLNQLPSAPLCAH